MKRQTLVAQLIQGSRNIDAMKKEINELVSMIIGYVLKHNKEKDIQILKNFESTKCVWEVSNVAIGDAKLKISCAVIETSETALRPHARYAYDSSYSKNINVEDVQIIHEDLPAFVEGMIKLFPYLNKSWKPLLKASNTVLFV